MLALSSLLIPWPGSRPAPQCPLWQSLWCWHDGHVVDSVTRWLMLPPQTARLPEEPPLLLGTGFDLDHLNGGPRRWEDPSGPQHLGH